MTQDDIGAPYSGLSAALPLGALALVFAAIVVFYATNGGTFSTAERNTPAVAHSNPPGAGGGPTPSTVR
jgi:hypothetical protein